MITNMEKLLPAEPGKGSYMPPMMSIRVVLFSKQAVCTSPDNWHSTTEQWDEVDLSNL